MDGKAHDRFAAYATPLIVGGSLFLTSPIQTAVIFVGYTAGWVWLSPDLDTRSRPLNRWGILKPLWQPYKIGVPHRGFSHWVLIGSLSRILYLAILLSPVLALTIYFLIQTGQHQTISLLIRAAFYWPAWENPASSTTAVAITPPRGSV